MQSTSAPVLMLKCQKPNIYEYSQDVGNLHVIDYRLWLAALPIRRPFAESPRSLRFSAADWSH